MLQANNPNATCMYVHTSFDTYSGRHALGLLCAGVIALCCAVLCCAVLCCARVLMLTDNTLVRTFAVAVYRYSIKKKAQKTKSGKKAQPAV